MKISGLVCLAAMLGWGWCAGYGQAEADRAAVLRTGEAIRAAFAAADVDAAMRYHHPEVRKAIAYDKVLVGREAVADNLRDTLKKFRLEFVRNDLESLLIEGDTAVEQTLFTIRVSPRASAASSDSGAASYDFKGRTMVVYVRYSGSPTGWASIRELIQPAPKE